MRELLNRLRYAWHVACGRPIAYRLATLNGLAFAAGEPPQNLVIAECTLTV